MAPLHALQDWFLTVMTAAGGVQRGAELAAARHALRFDEVVLHKHGAAPASRMRIYADGYVLRLLECLRADYPLLLAVMGDTLFTFFAKAYIWRHPSRSPSLYDLGEGFADFLASSQVTHGADDALLQLPISLARFERAGTEASRARGLERAGALEAQGVIAQSLALMLGQDLTLAAPPCLRLLDLALPLLPFVETLRAGGTPPPPPTPAPQQRSYLGVTRMHYRVHAHALDAWQFHVLQVLADADADADAMLPHEAARRAAICAGQAADQLEVQLMLWLPTAVASGLIVAALPAAARIGGRGPSGCPPP